MDLLKRDPRKNVFRELAMKMWKGRAAWLAVFAYLVVGFLGTAQAKDASVLEFDADWRLDGDLPEKAMLISLQGVVNKGGPELYFLYPESWPWKITGELKGFYESRHGFDFKDLGSAEAALAEHASKVSGYVVWDKEVRTSLIVAFTVCGLQNAIAVNEDLIPLAEAAGLKPVADLRGDFRGMDDAEIYEIAYDRYWGKTSKDVVIWMGGAHGSRMEPGLADYGIYREAFFCDLSASPEDEAELALHNKILSELNPDATIMGWHSYGKDTEGQHVSLISSYGLKMEGLNSLPNISFNCQIPFTDDFVFKNNHNVAPEETLDAEETVYVSLVQTDSMGIGAWTKPGRGRIPYAWQVSMSWSRTSPAALQYFAEAATPNDYFIAGLSGPGYMYPKPIPERRFWPLMDEAEELMEALDLRVMEIMDYSEGNRHVGNTDLPKSLVDRYYKAFPGVIGFINGYGSARTFDLRGERPMVSYDYYLGLHRPTEEAIADLEELIQLNRKRPYFLLIHVRESTTIDRVADILEGVSEEMEVVSLDVFLKLAASEQTYKQRYLQGSDPVDRNAYR
ncbi:GxGYxYP domain-containing protein [Pelagicoccus sp. SDUM812002]|uniref:GxGYxYP domain-containing protein n=1 Tax=Pelagicoccus sp. SDUM812002 TaxID=3041266 RepID=UPI00280CC357|nr:GxGYxYP domain-containing protein [Pelagicoccus sp. SDUM812002]MDQ8187698.1 GxGYxYP family putative glycoside hydrolase [Pelagicoccus sp. SDUM812002]